MTAHWRARLSPGSLTRVLLEVEDGPGTTRALRGYLACAAWSVAAVYSLAVRPSLPASHQQAWSNITVLAVVGAVTLALLPWRQLPDRTGPVAVVAGGVALVLGVGLSTGQLLQYLVALALVFGYTGITCSAGASLRIGVLLELALLVTTLGRQEHHLLQLALGLALYAVLGSIVGLITTRLRDEHETRERVNRALILLLATTSVDEAAALAARLGTDLLGVDGSGVLLADDPGSTVFRGVAGVGAGENLRDVEVDIAKETTALGRAVATAEPLYVEDTATSPLVSKRFVGQLGARTVLYLPVPGEGGVLGVLALWWSEPGHHLDHDHDSALTLLSVQLGQVLERHRRLDRLDTDAHTDSLTGLGNRRRFDLALGGMPVGGGVLLLDLDRFKAVNDTLGHAVGDEVLTTFADALRSCVRAGEACRIGGDEFAVVFSDNAAPAATGVVERLARAWSSEHAVTYCHGFAVHDDGSTPGGTVTRADMALYAAKRTRHTVSNR
ncbi:MAG TPA: sensor domain-containing diguanylate cyclase [Actinomycetes bacterium]|nr:sensor domain-containing diguanylate cyclase [Actinomycetes bacterium]